MANSPVVFSSSLVNGFDLIFMLIYFVYLGARTYGFHYGDKAASTLGSDWLAIGESSRQPAVKDCISSTTDEPQAQ